MNPYPKFGNSNSVTKKIWRNLGVLFLLVSACFGQTVNTNILPAQTGLNLGATNQRWNGYFQNLNIVGTCTLNGASCLGGNGNGGGNVFNGIGFGNSFQDVLFTARPNNPAAGICRLYLDNTTFQFSGITSSGASCMPSGGGGGSGTVTNIATGTGLTGGPISISGTIALLSSYQLPQTCGVGQVPTWSGTVWSGCANTSTGTVTGASTGFGLISVSGSTTLNFTLAGTSGGIPYFSSGSTWASSNALTQYGVVYGGGSGAAPNTTSADTTTTHALFATATAPAFRAIAAGDIPTLNQNTTGTASNITGTVAVGHGGTGNTVTALYNVPVGLSASTYNTTFAVPDCNGSSNALNFTQANLPSTDPWTCLSISTLSNPMTTLGDIIYGTTAGAVARLAGPTTPATPFVLTSIPSGGLATAPIWSKVGLAGRIVTGTSDTIVGSDNAHFVSYCNNASSPGPPCVTATPVTVTLPQAGTGCGTANDFCQNFVTILSAGPGLVTVTPTTSTINGNATLLIQQQTCRITSDNTNYSAHCFNDNSANPVQTDTGSANSYIVNCPGVASPVQVGDFCLMQAAHTNTGSSTINVSGLGSGTLTREGGGTLLAGDVAASPSLTVLRYDGTEWVVDNPQAAIVGVSTGAQGQPYVNTNNGTGNATTATWLDASQFIGADSSLKSQTAGAVSTGGIATNTVDDRAFQASAISNSGGECPWTASQVGKVLMPNGRWPITSSCLSGGKIYVEGTQTNDFSGITGSTLQAQQSSWTGGGDALACASSFSTTTHYARGQCVTCDSGVTCAGTSSYFSLQDSNTNHTPGTAGSPWWSILGNTPSPVMSTQSNQGAGSFRFETRHMSMECQSTNSNNTFADGCIGWNNDTDGQELVLAEDIDVFAGSVAGIADWGDNNIENSGPFGPGQVKAGTLGSQTDLASCKTVSSGTGLGTQTATVSSITVSGTAATITLSATPSFTIWTGELALFSSTTQQTWTNINSGYIDGTTNWYGIFHVWSVPTTTTTQFEIQVPSGFGTTCSSCSVSFFPVGILYQTPTTQHQMRGFHDFTINFSSCTNTSGFNNNHYDAFIPADIISSGGRAEFKDIHTEGSRVGAVIGSFGASDQAIFTNMTTASFTHTGILLDNVFGTPTNADIRNLKCNLNAGVQVVDCLIDLGNANVITMTNNPVVHHYWTDANGTAFMEGGNCADMTNGWCESNGVWAFYNGTTGAPTGFKQGSFGLNLVANGNLSAETTTAAATYTVGNLACVTATSTVGDCTTAGGNTAFIGVNLAKDGTAPNWAVSGIASVKSNASATFTAGDYVCTDASHAAVVVDNGASACTAPQRQVGIVATTNTGTSHTVSLNFSGAGSTGSSTATFDSTSIGAPAQTASWTFSNPSWDFSLAGTAPASSSTTGTVGISLQNNTGITGGSSSGAGFSSGTGGTGLTTTGGTGGAQSGGTVAGSPFTLTQVGVAGGVATYTGTITGGGSNAFQNMWFQMGGFTNGGNNQLCQATGSTGTTITCTAQAQINETHAGTATNQIQAAGGAGITVSTGTIGSGNSTTGSILGPAILAQYSGSGYQSTPGGDIFNQHNNTYINPVIKMVNPFVATNSAAGEIMPWEAVWNQWQGNTPASMPSAAYMTCFPGALAGNAWSPSTGANAIPSCNLNIGSIANVSTSNTTHGANGFFGWGNLFTFWNTAGAMTFEGTAGLFNFYGNPAVTFMGGGGPGGTSEDDIQYMLPAAFATNSIVPKQELSGWSTDGTTQQTLNSIVWTTAMWAEHQFINNSGGNIAQGTVVKYDTTTGHSGDFVEALHTDHGKVGILAGFVLTSGGTTCGNTAACSIAKRGIVAGDLTSSNTCALGNNVVISSATDGEVQCEAVGTSTGDILGTAISAETGGGIISVDMNCCRPGDEIVNTLTGDGTIITNSASTGPTTLTIAGTSGGIPYFSSSSAWASSAALASNGLVLGGGAGSAPKTAAGLTTDGTSALTLGVAGTSVGSVAFNNATSGTLTLSPVTGALGTHTISIPAAAGTIAVSATSPIALSAAGAISVPTIGTDSSVATASGTFTTNQPAVGDANGGITGLRGIITSIPSSDTISSAAAFATTESVAGTGLAVGSVIRIQAHGIFTTSSTANPVANFEVNAGGTTGICPANTTSKIITVSLTNQAWDLLCYIQIVTTGSPGTAIAWGDWKIASSSTTGAYSAQIFNANASTVSYTTGSAQNAGVQETGTLVAGQSFTLQSISVHVDY